MTTFIYPLTDPVVFSIGPFTGNWYGLWFEAGILLATIYSQWLSKKTGMTLKREDLSFLIFSGAIIILAGSRIGYILTATSYSFSADPYAVLRFWEGGTSVYGALIASGLFLAGYARYTGKAFLSLSDAVVPAGFIAVMAASAGDISNGVHWGSVSPHLPWAVLFPLAGCEDAVLSTECALYRTIMAQNGHGLLPRHPLQVYEFLLGLVFMAAVSLTARMKREVTGYATSVFLISCGSYKLLTLILQTEVTQNLLDPGSREATSLLLGAIVVTGGLFLMQAVTGRCRTAPVH